MKVLLINSVCGYGSTGRICADLARALIARGDEAWIAYGRRGAVPPECESHSIRIGTDLSVRAHAVFTRLTDRHGFASTVATKRFIQWVESYDPDLIHLHNLHGYYINVELLFDYLRKSKKPVVWTMHDCWAFTGHCSYFDAANCEHWKTKCRNCPQLMSYPKSWGADASEHNYSRKRRVFSGLDHVTLVTPSAWLKGLIRDSFLGDYPIEVIPNGINTQVFYPRTTAEISKALAEALPPDIKPGRYLLGVANEWEPRKGLSDFLLLAARLREEGLPIVLVGLRADQQRNLPEGVYGLSRTDSPDVLASLYSGCMAFLNLTFEDNYPTTNLEAAACGAYVITYDTGGCAEMIVGRGRAVAKGDIGAIEALIRNLPLPEETEIEPTVALDQETCLQSYFALYETCLKTIEK